MKRTVLLMAALCILNLVIKAQDREFEYAPSFRYSPDRDFDLAWENDLVAFRVYGKESKPNSGISGVDCWHKKVNYPIVYKWYEQLNENKSYHIDYGEGCDQYHVGNSRGCGGVGIWIENMIIRSGLYESWEVISLTQTTLKFKLVFRFRLGDEQIIEARIITLENGSQLYEAQSQFTKNGLPVKNLEIAIGLATEFSPAEVTLNKEEGWLSAWHELGEPQHGMIGTGLIVDTRYLITMLDYKPEDENPSNALAIVKTDVNGKINYKAGFAWEKANMITTHDEWDSYLRNY